MRIFKKIKLTIDNEAYDAIYRGKLQVNATAMNDWVSTVPIGAKDNDHYYFNRKHLVLRFLKRSTKRSVFVVCTKFHKKILARIDHIDPYESTGLTFECVLSSVHPLFGEGALQ